MSGDHPLDMPTRFPRAACLGMTALFYPDTGDNASVKAARAVCATCPEMHPCREAGMAEPVGVWGGLSARQRARIRKAVKGTA